MENQVISRKRVAEHGEVLTGSREVNSMLDLVKSEIVPADAPCSGFTGAVIFSALRVDRILLPYKKRGCSAAGAAGMALIEATAARLEM